MIELKNLFLNYDKRFSVLFNINLKFKKNNQYILYSENDLETQALFRILTKQDKDYTGEIFLNSKNLKDIKLKELSIGYVTKTAYLLKFKTVKYNIAYPLIIRKENKKLSLEKAEKLLIENLQENLINKKIKNLTNFEKILITLFRVIIRNPDVILIDNIFSNLKENEEKIIINLINKLNQNKIILIAVNNENIIKKFNINNIIYFKNGNIENK